MALGKLFQRLPSHQAEGLQDRPLPTGKMFKAEHPKQIVLCVLLRVQAVDAHDTTQVAAIKFVWQG